jgi:hypothetical protein
MNLSSITSYLVSPGKHLPHLPEVKGTHLPRVGKFFTMLEEVFVKADRECDIPIRFVMSDEGWQQNEARDLIVSYLECPDLPRGTAIAQRLSRFTTNSPGMGLLFLLLGSEGTIKKLVVSRFPAEKGVLADAQDRGLQLEFIERVFMKSMVRYKAVRYQDTSLKAGFWTGSAIDKQLDTRDREVANYWIRDFLLSDFVTTSRAGTKRLAIALREASRQAKDPAVKREIVSVGILVGGLTGKATSIQGIMDDYHLSPEARDALSAHVVSEDLLTDTFILDETELRQHARYASVELSNEAILLAPADRFNTSFQKETVDPEKEIYRFSTEGTIVDERIQGRK